MKRFTKRELELIKEILTGECREIQYWDNCTSPCKDCELGKLLKKINNYDQ